MFGAGYVLGTRAGRERYTQIAEAAGKAAERLRAPDGTAAGVPEPTVRLDEYLRGVSAGDGRRS